MASSLPNGYAQLLDAARQSLVRMPDGTYQPAPQYGGPTSVDELYRGIFPSAPQVSAADPIGQGTRPSGGYLQLQDMLDALGARPTIRAAGIPSTPGTGSNALAAINATVPHANGSILNDKGQDRLGPGTALAFAGDEGSAVPLPRVRPAPPPLAPAAAAPAPASPQPQSGDYVVKRGDTLWAISQRTGIPVTTLAKQSGISDPSKIYVGQTLSLGAAARPAIASQAAPRPMPFPAFRQLIAPPVQRAVPGRLPAADPWALLRGVSPAPAPAGLVTGTPRPVPQAAPVVQQSNQPKYAVSTAPGTFNRSTGTWNY